MSSFSSQGSDNQAFNNQTSYPPRYGPTSNINSNMNERIQQINGYSYPTQQPQYPPQYPNQAQYTPQAGFQQQGYYPPQRPYQAPNQGNIPYDQGTQYQQYGQNPQGINPTAHIYNPNLSAPPTIPQNSPLLRHPLSQIISYIRKNLQQFPKDFQQKFEDNESFKSINRKTVFIPSFLIMAHVLMNRNKKWFRLTVNARLIRFSLFGLLMLHLSTNVLYVAAYRDLIARNRDKIEKIIVREEFLGSGTSR